MEQFPSEHQPKESHETPVQLMHIHGLHISRMISGSKSRYIEDHKDKGDDYRRGIIFNANIISRAHGKFWYGDLDVNIDAPKLKEVAKQLNEDLLVLREMDARFENDNQPYDYYLNKAAFIIKK
jgi:hypothetical protein